jgi:hypothetical protein
LKPEVQMPTKLDSETIAAAIEGFNAQKKKLEAKISELRAMLVPQSPKESAAQARPRRRTLSAAARKRIAAAQRKRWKAAKAAASGLEQGQPDRP